MSEFESRTTHMDIGIVTTAWGDYGTYLPDWISSMCSQTVPPSMITIVNAGTDTAAAEKTLEGCEIPWQIVRVPYEGMGAARNAAVAHTDTKWVMHLDADDTLLPHAIKDVAAVPGADVIVMGMRIDGKDVTFPHTSREFILAGGIGCFSCAPFRRSLWEKRPYITANDWVDSALWVGFAHEGAQFVPTQRAGAVYRQHDDSFTRKLTDADRKQAVRQHGNLCKNPDLKL